MEKGAASPSSKSVIAVICRPVFHLASFETGTPIDSPARNSRKPETSISRHTITIAASTSQSPIRS